MCLHFSSFDSQNIWLTVDYSLIIVDIDSRIYEMDLWNWICL